MADGDDLYIVGRQRLLLFFYCSLFIIGFASLSGTGVSFAYTIHIDHLVINVGNQKRDIH